MISNFNIYCIHSFFATLGVESDLVAFPDVVDQAGDVYKDFLLGGVVYDKTKSFGLVEELYCSVTH